MKHVEPLANYLRMYRKRGGFTQREVAFLLGATHRSKVSRYERGVRSPSFATIVGYEVIFQASAAQLFSGAYAKVAADVRSRARQLSKRVDAQPFAPAAKQKLDALAASVFPPKHRDAA
ncbi:MAG: helix-turn-helix transcriptional regulator [Planctomycetes bacterium]|nr:helix-turn-helix transcriptional regulator [Planctomycetota bacterium]